MSEQFVRRLKKQIEGQNRGREEVKLKIEEIEEKVLRRERYLKVDILDDDDDDDDDEGDGDDCVAGDERGGISKSWK